MRRCQICEKADCVCGMDMFGDDASEAVLTGCQAHHNAPAPIRASQFDIVQAMCLGAMAGFLAGFILGVAAIASGG